MAYDKFRVAALRLKGAIGASRSNAQGWKNVRPFPLCQERQRAIPDSVVKPDYSGLTLTRARSQASKVTNKSDIKKLRSSCALARDTRELAMSLAKPGTTTDEIDYQVHQFVVANNAYPSPEVWTAGAVSEVDLYVGERCLLPWGT